MTPKVLNKRTDVIPPDAVYVGRPSKWGNPYRIEPDIGNTRELVIGAYREWLINQPLLLEQLSELRGKDLVCWCAPKPCHADVLLEMANKEEGC